MTPLSRRQIVAGKFLASFSPWPAVLGISIPYLALLSPNDVVLEQALLWGALSGSLLVAAFTGFGMLVSIWSNSNKTSLFTSLTICLLFVLPTQLPGTAKTGAVGQLIQRLNPIEAANHFLMKIVVNNHSPDVMGSWLLSPVLFAVIVLALLFWYASPGLRLSGGIFGILRTPWSRAAGLFIAASLLLSPVSPATALQTAVSAAPERGLQISINIDHKVVKNRGRD